MGNSISQEYTQHVFVNRLRSTHSLAMPLLIGAGCTVYLFSGLDLNRLWESWHGFSLTYLAVAILLGALNIAGLGLRLRALAGACISLLNSCKAALVGLSLNALLPARLGEIGKITCLAEHGVDSAASATHLVFWERFLDVHVLLAAVLASVFFGLPTVFSLAAFTIVGCLWLGLAIIYRHQALAQRLLRLLPYQRLQGFLSELVEHLSLGLPPRRLAAAAALSLIPWGVYVVQLTFVLNFSLALDLSFNQQLAVLLAASLSSSVPLTPGAIGIYEAAIVAVLTQFNIDKELALTAAIMMHAMLYIPVLFGAAWTLGMAPRLLNGSAREPR
jgi:uncharacterized protein (TIRG00374 family)